MKLDNFKVVFGIITSCLSFYIKMITAKDLLITTNVTTNPSKQLAPSTRWLGLSLDSEGQENRS